ncbi:methyl-accepting chemotaxis protein [Virgibacillus salexigens]|uniref:methyl-accepting chemotaxis protein n=1 Tax=Virgibacillus salexigens TaxID=61016 RepID=UPI003081A306
MEKLMNFKRLKNKLYVSFSIVIISSCLLGVYHFISVGKTNQQVEQMIHEDFRLVQYGNDINVNVASQTGLVRGFLLYEDEAYREQYYQMQENNSVLENKILELSNVGEVNTLVDLKNQWEATVEKVFNLYDNGNLEEALFLMTEEVEPLESQFRTGIEQLLAATEEMATADGQAIISDGKTTYIVIIAVTLLVAILSIAIELFTVRLITAPISKVLRRMKQIAKGELNHQPLTTILKDELGQLIHITNEMNQNTNHLLGRIQTVSETVTSHSSYLAESAKETKAGSEQVATTMQELSAGAETQADSAGDLATNMEVFVSKVQDTHDQSKLIEQASGEVLTMTKDGDQMMKSSSKQMQRINEIVKDAVDKVEGLDTQSQEISKLVTVIKDVAEQTNLLALNAAIEAARAGEHGKGFAVVADEVRKLAEQVAGSVTVISNNVSQIQGNSSEVAESLVSSYKEVEEGNVQIKMTQETFDGIQLYVTEMVNTIRTMTANLSEMYGTSNQVNNSIQEIASITEESSAGIEQTSAAAQQSSSSMEEVVDSSKQLAKLADDLNDLIRQFQL